MDENKNGKKLTIKNMKWEDTNIQAFCFISK